MRKIKKYANRKLYDTQEKRYISMDNLLELIKAGEEITVIENQTGEDLTATIVSQLIGRDRGEKTREVPPSVLIQLLRKGRGTIADYAKKYASLWQNALTMAEDEIDRLVNLLVRDKELSETEGRNLKREIMGYSSNLKNWISENIDQRLKEMLGRMNLTSKDDVKTLNARLDALDQKVALLEKRLTAKPGKPGKDLPGARSRRK